MSKAHIVLGTPLEKELDIEVTSENILIGVDRGALYLVENGYEIDLAIGDFDSISGIEKEKIKQNTKQMEAFQAEKDDTDTELSLLYTEELFSPDAMIIHNWMGGRLDHFMSLLYLAVQPRFSEVISKLTFKNAENTLSFYHPGKYTIEKEKGKFYLSYIGMTPLKKLSLKDVKYTLDETDYDYPIALISNEFVGKPATFSFEEGILAVVQSTDK